MYAFPKMKIKPVHHSDDNMILRLHGTEQSMFHSRIANIYRSSYALTYKYTYLFMKMTMVWI